jgi:regulatory protein
MPRITAIEPQRRRGRVSVFLDGVFAVGVDEAVAAGLRLAVGQEVGAEELQAIVGAETRRRAKDSALRWLSLRARSRAEVQRGLERKGYESPVIEEVLEELSRQHLLDDRDFTRAWVQARTSGRPMGARRIAHELRGKGVSSELIQEALEARGAPEEELELALAVGRQTVKRVRGEDPARARRKLAAALQRRGFSWSVTSAVVEKLLPGESEASVDDDA